MPFLEKGAQWCFGWCSGIQPCPFQLPGSRCISSPTLKIKLNQLRPLATALPHGSEAATMPSRVPHTSSTHTQRWDVGEREGGKEAAASSDTRIASPVLHYSEPTSKDGPQLWLRAVGSPMQCCLPQGNTGSLWDQGRRNSLGERLTSSPQWQHRHWGGRERHSQPKNIQVQIFLSATFIGLTALLLCQEYPVSRALPFFAIEKIVLMTEHLFLPACWLFHQATWTFH